MSIETTQALIADKGIEFFLCSFVEMSGVPKSKLVPATHLDDMAREGGGFAGFACGEMGQGPHSPDMAAIPDFSSLQIVPFRPNLAWVAGDVHVEGAPYPFCPRGVLKRQLEIARAKGFSLFSGVEPEFMLLGADEKGGFAPYDALDTLEKPCYDLRALNRNLDLMTELMKALQFLGWEPYANDHEDANCQFEINWTYSDALLTADRLTFYRWMVRSMAEKHGLTATFMPKPFSHLTGNGCHHHLSLWNADATENLFLDKGDENGLSALAYAFIGGLKAHAKGLCALFAPTVNSYKRLVKGAPKSGATWAPVYISWGGSNRTQMIRIPGAGRIELRTADGSINAYLAAAAMLAAGLDGIEKSLPAGEKNLDNLYELSDAQLRERGIECLPSNLSEALDELEKDAVLMEMLGPQLGPEFLRVKRAEWKSYHDSVSSWEMQKYLGVF